MLTPRMTWCWSTTTLLKIPGARRRCSGMTRTMSSPKLRNAASAIISMMKTAAWWKMSPPKINAVRIATKEAFHTHRPAILLPLLSRTCYPFYSLLAFTFSQHYLDPKARRRWSKAGYARNNQPMRQKIQASIDPCAGADLRNPDAGFGQGLTNERGFGTDPTPGTSGSGSSP